MAKYSESDMGSMSDYDPNLGMGKAGMRAAFAPQHYSVTHGSKVKSSGPMAPKPAVGTQKPASVSFGATKTGGNSNSTPMMV